jgi:hypothetical protein
MMLGAALLHTCLAEPAGAARHCHAVVRPLGFVDTKPA